MTKPVFKLNGLRYDGYQKGPKRMKDLTPEEAARKESGAPVFSTGWTQRLRERGLLITCEDDKYWFVQRQEAIDYLGCTTDTLRKTLERHYWLYAISQENYEHISFTYGFTMEKVANQKRKKKPEEALADPAAMAVAADPAAAAGAVPLQPFDAVPVAIKPKKEKRKKRQNDGPLPALDDDVDFVEHSKRKRRRVGDDGIGIPEPPPKFYSYGPGSPEPPNLSFGSDSDWEEQKDVDTSATIDDGDSQTTEEASTPSVDPAPQIPVGEFDENGLVVDLIDRSQTLATLDIDQPPLFVPQISTGTIPRALSMDIKRQTSAMFKREEADGFAPKPLYHGIFSSQGSFSASQPSSQGSDSGQDTASGTANPTGGGVAPQS